MKFAAALVAEKKNIGPRSNKVFAVMKYGIRSRKATVSKEELR